MHVPQIRGAITRDLITKYHYFHTSFQIWPDQIKAGGEGDGGRREQGKTAPLAGSFVQGYLNAGGNWCY